MCPTKLKHVATLLISLFMITACETEKKATNQLDVTVYETSESGNQLTLLTDFEPFEDSSAVEIRINPEKTFQTITGFGGAFTESSAYLLNQLGEENRQTILNAYFSREGANYSLTRTHMNSCDFSLTNYSYTPTPSKNLADFSVEEDMGDLIPMIKDAMTTSEDGFKIFASPWTAPPWMKDNNRYVGGKLLPEYYDTWALFFSKYLTAYKKQGIELWGFTVENEPHGNGNNWESMHFTPEEMTEFVRDHLGPQLERDGYGEKIILGYDQNREGVKEWVDEMYKNEENAKYYDGTAVHWYESTYEVFPEELQYAHNKAPDQYLIQTEACVDSEIPHWKDDAWYWKKEATDWGYDWREEEKKFLHPKYAPVNRYARDIIGCMNNWVDGWVDWNMVLDRQGGPNWFENWCVAPVIVDPDADEVYFTPIYYTMAHFSKYIRPGATVIETEFTHDSLLATAAQNPDGSIAVVLFNQEKKAVDLRLRLGENQTKISINPQAIQTILLKN